MYVFHGFFCDGGPEVGEAAVRRWPRCQWRPVTDPFVGVGVRGVPVADAHADGPEAAEALNIALAFAANFPHLTFVWIDAECFGGTYEYAGRATRNGVVLPTVPPEQPGWESLGRLLEPLGVRLRDEYFAPFLRGFWDGC